MNYIPTVMEETQRGARSFDLYSRLLKDRIILLNGEINDDTATIVTGQLLYLDQENPGKDIHIYINSPGGSVSAGLAIYDTMKYINSDVSTVCMGIAASMGSFLLAGGTKGKRFILPNAEVMIHQPLGGAQGQCSDIQITANHIQRTKDRLNRILAENTGNTLDQITTATDRDNWLTAEEALAFGIIDQIIQKN